MVASKLRDFRMPVLTAVRGHLFSLPTFSAIHILIVSLCFNMVLPGQRMTTRTPRIQAESANQLLDGLHSTHASCSEPFPAIPPTWLHRYHSSTPEACLESDPSSVQAFPSSVAIWHTTPPFCYSPRRPPIPFWISYRPSGTSERLPEPKTERPVWFDPQLPYLHRYLSSRPFSTYLLFQAPRMDSWTSDRRPHDPRHPLEPSKGLKKTD